jgi:hypothetical protein
VGMKIGRIFYRVRQFTSALHAAPDPQDLEDVGSILKGDQLALYLRMQPGEQAHSLEVLRLLQAQQAEEDPVGGLELRAAALLHDVGKICAPLQLWERVLIVLGKALLPGQSCRWGALPAEQLRETGWRSRLQRPFMIAARHPAWGAELAETAGASPLTVTLIRRHQDTIPNQGSSLEDRLLARLQAADDQN